MATKNENYRKMSESILIMSLLNNILYIGSRPAINYILYWFIYFSTRETAFILRTPPRPWSAVAGYTRIIVVFFSN